MSAGRNDSLLVAAVAGLFAGCSGDDPSSHHHHQQDTTCGTTTTPVPTTTSTGDTSDTTTGPTSTDPYTLSVEVNTTIEFADFKKECDSRGGLIQTTAACAGNNFCRGFSFNVHTKELMEHTCKAMNSCHGASCVVLPEDKGFDGETVYEATCGFRCHGPPVDQVLVLVPPGSDHAAKLTEFQTTSRDYYIALVAFGMHAMNTNGTAAANAPFRYEEWSAVELGRAIDWMRSLPATVEEYGIVGETEDLN